jgi:hydrogenase-4 component E
MPSHLPSDAPLSLLAVTASSVILLCTLVIFWRKHIPAYIGAFRWQSISLSVVGLVVAWFGDEPELFAVAGMVLVLKGLLVPGLLRRMAAALPTQQEPPPLVNTEVSLLISGCLAIAAYEVSRPLAEVIALPTRGGLPIALAVILVSLFVVVSRRNVVTQIVGFLMLENGIALLALLGAYGVPLVVELGVFLDVLLGVLVMQVLVHRIHASGDADATPQTAPPR